MLKTCEQRIVAMCAKHLLEPMWYLKQTQSMLWSGAS